jgi:tetratricopeptide (TPR) repeat protein
VVSPGAAGPTRETGIALLDRAAEVGLLASLGGGYYSIHPAVPWFFREIFASDSGISEVEAQRAFVEAVGELGDYYHNTYQSGRREVMPALRAEETNLLQARRLALENGWWDRVPSAMQGLKVLYNHLGRRAEWRRLVEEVVPAFVEPGTELPLAGREDQWSFVMGYRVRLAQEERKLREAERLEKLVVAWNKARAAPLLAQPPETLDATQRNLINSFASSLHELGEIQRERGRSECVANYKESLHLAEQIGVQHGAAACALNLGHAYKDLTDIRNLFESERWYQHSLELRNPGDRLGRGICTQALGNVALERFLEAKAESKPDQELLSLLNQGVSLYRQALTLLPEDAVPHLALVHKQLGSAYGEVGDLDRALPHYQKAIRYLEASGNLFLAARARSATAIHLARVSRFEEALAYANAALRGFETYGERAAAEVAETRKLIEQIQRHLQRPG